MTWEAFLAFKVLETSTRDAFKRVLGDFLATNLVPKSVPRGGWGAFKKRQGGVLGPRNAQELPWWPSGRELGPQECPKRGLGSVLATNFAPKGVPIGAWGAFFKRQGGVLGLRNAQELLWWPSGRELGPQEPFPDGRIQPNCFRNA